jgi:hypothetical protein
MDVPDLIADYRSVDAALQQLVEIALINDRALQPIQDVRAQLKTELKRRGYSEEQIADLS